MGLIVFFGIPKKEFNENSRFRRVSQDKVLSPRFLWYPKPGNAWSIAEPRQLPMESITHRLSAAGENHDDPMLKFNTQQKCHVKFDGKTHGKTM